MAAPLPILSERVFKFVQLRASGDSGDGHFLIVDRKPQDSVILPELAARSAEARQAISKYLESDQSVHALAARWRPRRASHCA